jgi:hypothetical protein
MAGRGNSDGSTVASLESTAATAGLVDSALEIGVVIENGGFPVFGCESGNT